MGPTLLQLIDATGSGRRREGILTVRAVFLLRNVSISVGGRRGAVDDDQHSEAGTHRSNAKKAS